MPLEEQGRPTIESNILVCTISLPGEVIQIYLHCHSERKRRMTSEQRQASSDLRANLRVLLDEYVGFNGTARASLYMHVGVK